MRALKRDSALIEQMEKALGAAQRPALLLRYGLQFYYINLTLFVSRCTSCLKTILIW